MQRQQVLGLCVLVCLSASRVSAAESKRSGEASPSAEQQRQAEEAVRQAEAQRQQVQAEFEAAARKKAEFEQQFQSLQQQQQDVKKSAGPEPSLNLPIRWYVFSAVFGGLGYATGLLSRGPERDLRNPAKHPTQDETLSLYRKAHYGGLISKGFYSLSGAAGAYAAYRTQSSVREYFTAKARMAALQKEANQRLAQARSPEERKATEVSNALLLPPEPAATELSVTAPEPPPLQAGFFVDPAGDAAVSLSVSF